MQLRLIVICIPALVFIAASARADVADHLKCYKIKDPLNLSATADLNTPLFGADAGCSISKAKLFCVPATKTNVSAKNKTTGTTITLQRVDGPDPGARICYKVKCPASVPDQEISDQFGTRTVGVVGSSLLCTPAVQGPVPTTTTTTTTTTLSCGSPSLPCCGSVCNVGCCVGGTCVAEGQQCGAPSCSDSTACAFEGDPTCDETGTKQQNCTPQVCSTGSCTAGTPFSQTIDCSRSTDGTTCLVTQSGCPVNNFREICCSGGTCSQQCAPCGP
ncbi:MAG TPA: hypothetical protein VGK20_12535 [Candidatus Binatia bacterium]|jgi:hypothetical protein